MNGRRKPSQYPGHSSASPLKFLMSLLAEGFRRGFTSDQSRDATRKLLLPITQSLIKMRVTYSIAQPITGVAILPVLVRHRIVRWCHSSDLSGKYLVLRAPQTPSNLPFLFFFFLPSLSQNQSKLHSSYSIKSRR